METHQLLFELSHPVRYEIMQIIAEKPQRLTKIGEQVDANNPEVSRHLDRLRKSSLVEKDKDGFYYTTSFGKLTMSILPFLSFITSHPEYFLEHDLSILPQEFICRLGELESCDLIEGTTVNIYRLDQISRDCTERIYTVSNEYVTKIKEEDFAEFDRIIAGDFKFRYILQESQLDDKNLMELVDHCCSSKNTHFRVIPQVPLFCSIIDDEIMITFLDTKGKADFSVSFYSQEPKVLKWCEDLLDYLWDQGRPPSEFR